MKNICCFLVLISFCLPACRSGRVWVPYNEVRNAVAAAYPDFMCDCKDTINGGLKLNIYKKPNSYSSFWYSVAIRDSNELNTVLPMSEKINKQLLTNIPALQNYFATFQQYSVFDSTATDTAQRYKIIGSSCFIRGKCYAYVPGMTGKQLSKKILKPKFVKSLCK